MIGSMISLVSPDSHLSIRLVRRRRLLPPQVAEEEAENLEAGPEEEEEEENESMDEAEGSLPSLGKRRLTDTALSGQTSAKRSRPGSLAEVGLPSLNHLRIHPCIHASIVRSVMQRVSCPVVQHKSVLSSSLCEVRLLTVGVADVNAATD